MKVKDELKRCKHTPEKVKEEFNFDNNGLFKYYDFLCTPSAIGAVVKCANGEGGLGFLKTEDGELLVEDKLWMIKKMKKRK